MDFHVAKASGGRVREKWKREDWHVTLRINPRAIICSFALFVTYGEEARGQKDSLCLNGFLSAIKKLGLPPHWFSGVFWGAHQRRSGLIGSLVHETGMISPNSGIFESWSHSRSSWHMHESGEFLPWLCLLALSRGWKMKAVFYDRLLLSEHQAKNNFVRL